MNAITKGYQDVPMTRRRAQLLEEYASKLADMLEAAPNDKDLAEWVQSKIDRAAAAIQSAYHYLDQEDESELEKAVGHKYTHRKLVGRDPKTNRARYRYYYAEHQGGGISRAKFEAGSAFKLTWKGRRGHFHIQRVEGDQIFITHDSRPNMEPVPVQADELRALLKKQHSKAEQKHVEKRRRKVEEIKRRAHRGGLGLALHRLRQAAAQAGVTLPEQYQRKPKKTRAPVAETAREVEAPEKLRAESERREWAETLDQLEAQAGNEIQAGASREEVEKRYQKLAQRLLRTKQSVISARARTASSAITGAGQFNARQAQKRQQTLERREAEYRQALQKIKDTQPPAQTTPRDQLTSTAQQIIEDANQEHAERHDEHQEITRFELGEHTHTKTGAKLFTAKQTERVERDEYFRRVAIAKKYKGRYERRYVKGFVFKNAEDARAFALEVEGAAQEAPETSAETVTPHDEHPGADNFETMPEVEARDLKAYKRVRRLARKAEKLDRATGRRTNGSKKADQSLAQAARSLLETEFADLPSTQEISRKRQTRLTPEEARKAAITGALNKLERNQTASRAGSAAQAYENRSEARAILETEMRDRLEAAAPLPTPRDRGPQIEEPPRTTIYDDVPLAKPRPEPRAQTVDKYTAAVYSERLDTKPAFKYSDTRGAIERYQDGVTSTKADRELLEEVAGDLSPFINRLLDEHRPVSLGLPGADARYQRYKDYADHAGFTIPSQMELKAPGRSDFEIIKKIGMHLLSSVNLTETSTRGDLTKELARGFAQYDEATRDKQPKAQPTTPREQLTETAREVTQSADNFETMPEVEAPAREQLIETAEQATAPSSPLDIDQANAQDTLTENRTRAPESKAADKALIESARELAKTSERGEEIKSALVDLMNAQQLKRYKRATGDTRARAEDMIEKRREARERLRAATSGEVINNFETMPEVEAQPKKRPSIYTRSGMVSYNKVDSIMEGKTPSRLPLKTRAQFEKIESLIAELEQMEQRRTKSGRLKDWQGIKAKREEILNARRVLLQKYASGRTRTQHSALQDHTFLSYYKPAKSTATPEEVRDKHGDRRSDLRTLRRYFETYEPDQQGQLTEAAETLDTRSTQQKTFTPEIQTAISYPVYGRRRNRTKKSFESLFKTRKDGGIFRMSKGEDIEDLAYAITENLPEAVREYKAEIGMEGLSSLIANKIREAIEQRETPAELKDRIGEVITQRAQDNAVRRKEEIAGRGKRAALREMRRNIMTPSGDGHFDHQGRGGPRSYVGLGAIEKTLDMSERLDDLYVDAIFKQALPPELERFKAPISRFEPKAADQVAVAFANKYETVGEIRDNISTIREQMRATIKSAVDTTADALVKRPNTLDMIKRSHEMITEQRDTQRQKAAEAARALAQYTDDPQAHLAEIQELERQSDQAIAEQMEINREFADAYIHEASDLVERALETTKGEVIDNVMSVKTPKHAGKFTASVQGKANRKLMARIFNEVFEQVTREIRDEPIERGEKHPRNIADTVKKPSKTPTQFRSDIERADKKKRERALAEREARRARRVQKSARPLITYRAQLIQTVERLTA